MFRQTENLKNIHILFAFIMSARDDAFTAYRIHSAQDSTLQFSVSCTLISNTFLEKIKLLRSYFPSHFHTAGKQAMEETKFYLIQQLLFSLASSLRPAGRQLEFESKTVRKRHSMSGFNDEEGWKASCGPADVTFIINTKRAHAWHVFTFRIQFSYKLY